MYQCISDDLTILLVNCTQEKPCILHKTFRKLDLGRKSKDDREIVERYLANLSPGYGQNFPSTHFMVQLEYASRIED